MFHLAFIMINWLSYYNLATISFIFSYDLKVQIFAKILSKLQNEIVKRQRKRKNILPWTTCKNFLLLLVKTTSTTYVRILTVMLLSFVGFLRYSEVSDLCWCDIDFQETFLRIFFEKSKTDFYRDGHLSLKSKIDSNICPAKLTRL